MREAKEQELKAHACAYIMHGLLQRLELTQPGLVESLLNGVRSDQQASLHVQDAASFPAQIFSEAIKMLELIQAQNELSKTS